VAVIGGGVVGCACAAELARRGADVLLAEAENGLALWASGTNSGILHTGFDSEPGALETELILRAVSLRDRVDAPLLRCGALMRDAPAEYPRNGVEAVRDGVDLFIPGEWVTDPVVFTHALAAQARAHGARIEVGRRVEDPRELDADVVVNAAGLGGGAFDGSFGVYPRKGEFFVFEGKLDRILLPAPTPRTKGILVFPTVAPGYVIAGPTAVDLDEPDWSVRAEARDEVLAKARQLLPELGEPIDSYAGLRPAGRGGANYVIGWSPTVPGLLNVGAIRSTGLSSSLGIAQYVADLVGASRWWERAARDR
jgi:glycerol-3-phosphate dehydrogenase